MWVVSVSRSQWLEELAASLGTPVPTADEVDALLRLAGDAAHASERTAAPLSAWLVGQAGCPVEEAAATVRRLAERISAPPGSGAPAPQPSPGTG